MYILCKNNFGVVDRVFNEKIGMIPFDPDNTDYQKFLKYQAEGGKVYGADEEIPADEGTQ